MLPFSEGYSLLDPPKKNHLQVADEAKRFNTLYALAQAVGWYPA